MRTVTLGSLGAVAPVVPAGTPQFYGFGEATAESASQTKVALVGFSLGFVLGAFAAYQFKKR